MIPFTVKSLVKNLEPEVVLIIADVTPTSALDSRPRRAKDQYYSIVVYEQWNAIEDEKEPKYDR